MEQELQGSTKFLLGIGMLVSGSVYTLSLKVADVTSAEDSHGQRVEFYHPYVQACGMFLGEFLCAIFSWIWFCVRGKPKPAAMQAQQPKSIEEEEEEPPRPVNYLVFIIPAFCDMVATCLMYIGLDKTLVSVYEMLRGSMIVFTAAMSVMFLKRRLFRFHWLGIGMAVIGLLAVGLASLLLEKDAAASDPFLGDLCVILASAILAVQMVVEEKILSTYPHVQPVEIVGWEGAWGLLMMGGLLVAAYQIPGSCTDGRMENAPDAFVQMSHSPVIILATLANVASIAVFNLFGITVTKLLSATTRMLIEAMRTVVIWSVSLAAGWQKFHFMQLVGFLILLLGTCVYHRVLPLPCFATREETELLNKAEHESEPAIERINSFFGRVQSNLSRGSRAGAGAAGVRSRASRGGARVKYFPTSQASARSSRASGASGAAPQSAPGNSELEDSDLPREDSLIAPPRSKSRELKQPLV